MKISLIVLHLAFIFSGTQSLVAEQEATGELRLGSAPTLGDLTAANIKLLNPDRQFDRGPQKSLSLKAEPITLALKISKGESKAIHFDQIQAVFRRDDFNDPGKYYPPKDPVDAKTPISSLDLITTVDADQLPAVASDLGNVLNLNLDKLNAWIDNRLWEETEGIELRGAAPNTIIQFYVGRQKDQKQEFVIRLSLQWDQNIKPQKGDAGDGDKPAN